MPSNSLGFQTQTPRAKELPHPPVPTVSTQEPRYSSVIPQPQSRFYMLKGFLPVALFSAIALMSTLLTSFDDVSPWVSFGFAIAISLMSLFVNDLGHSFNFALFLHIGAEVNILTKFYENTPFYWAFMGVIIAHLLPFLVVSWPMFLVFLSTVGVAVNLIFVYLNDAAASSFYLIFPTSYFLQTMSLLAWNQCRKFTMFDWLLFAVTSSRAWVFEPFLPV